MSDGRPAGRTGTHVNGAASPGHHRWAYGGDVEGTAHDGPFVEDRGVGPGRAPGHPWSEPRESAPPVGIRCYRHEGIVLGNHQRFRGLDWLTGVWELCLADGRTLTGPAPLPGLRPGETAAVPLPFQVPRDGGEAWLSLRVTVAEDRPGAPRGSEVCVARARLRGPAADADVATAGDVAVVRRAQVDGEEPGGPVPRRPARGLDALVRDVVPAGQDGGRMTADAAGYGPGTIPGHRLPPGVRRWNRHLRVP